MNTSISVSSQCYGLYDEQKIIGFCAIIHFPHPKNKKIKKVTRLVILPDYQGIGLGTKFLTEVANQYSDFDFTITTSAKNLIYSLNKNKKWALMRYDSNSYTKTGLKGFNKTIRANVKTATFKYVSKSGD